VLYRCGGDGRPISLDTTPHTFECGGKQMDMMFNMGTAMFGETLSSTLCASILDGWCKYVP
jgi:hypothetical protein